MLLVVRYLAVCVVAKALFKEGFFFYIIFLVCLFVLQRIFLVFFLSFFFLFLKANIRLV